MEQLTEIRNETEMLQDFIKVSLANNEISERCALELLRITNDIKDKTLI